VFVLASFLRPSASRSVRAQHRISIRAACMWF
jgi:hypothetical protein